MFVKAKKSQSKARVCLVGPSGSGKTYTALLIAQALGDRIAVVDTEHGSAAKYAGEFDFDVANLTSYSPENYIKAIQAAEAAGYDVLIIDSLSHAWAGPDGVLEMVDRAAAKYRDNRFSAWRDATPLHNRLVHAIVTADLHVIATLRSKTEYVLVQDERGRTTPKKVGLAPIQREGMDYEFDIVGELDLDHNITITKSRCHELAGYRAAKPGRDLGLIIKRWLEDGAPAAEVPANQMELRKLAEAAAACGLGAERLRQLVIQVTGKSASAELTSADVSRCLRAIYQQARGDDMIAVSQ